MAWTALPRTTVPALAAGAGGARIALRPPSDRSRGVARHLAAVAESLPAAVHAEAPPVGAAVVIGLGAAEGRAHGGLVATAGLDVPVDDPSPGLAFAVPDRACRSRSRPRSRWRSSARRWWAPHVLT